VLRFFFFYAMALSGVQAFAPEARASCTRAGDAGAMCLTIYMVCSAAAWWSAASWRPTRRAASASSARLRRRRAIALLLGFADVPRCGAGAVRRDGLRRRHRRAVARPAGQALAPDNATGVSTASSTRAGHRQAVAPLIFGTLMDWHQPALVWLGIAVVQAC
jgi:hypothetical protein